MRRGSISRHTALTWMWDHQDDRGCWRGSARELGVAIGRSAHRAKDMLESLEADGQIERVGVYSRGSSWRLRIAERPVWHEPEDERWPPEAVATLEELCAAGLGPAAIARHMGRTRHAIHGKLQKLRLLEARGGDHVR